MTAALADVSGQGSFTLVSRDLALELHRLLTELDRRRFRAERASAMRARLEALRARMAEATEAHDDGSPVSERLSDLRELVDAHAPAVDRKGEWIAFRARVQPAYEAMAAALRDYDIHVPSLRPTNYARNVLHVGTSLFSLSIVELSVRLSGGWAWALAIATGFALAGWTLEITRRRSEAINRFCMTLFGRTAHPHEAFRVNSATWYCSALVLLALSGASVPVAAALVTLGFGDPMAAIIGRRFGRVTIANGRTLEGTLAFIAAGGLATLLALLALHPGLGVGTAALVSLGAATLGAISELLTRRIDDNLAIPLAAWCGAAATLALVS